MTADFCFATLALGKPYRDMALLLAGDLEKYAPGKLLVVATDAPGDFSACANVKAYPHQRTGLFRCINDKRFAIEHALAGHADTAVFLDADTRITKNLPREIDFNSKISAIWTPDFAEHTAKWMLPKASQGVLDACRSMGVDPASILFVWDNLFAVSRDSGRERIFIKVWGHLTQFFDFQGISVTDGYCMSIAAAVAGWIPSERGMKVFEEAREHAEASVAPRGSAPQRLFASLAMKWRWLKFRRSLIASLKK